MSNKKKMEVLYFVEQYIKRYCIWNSRELSNRLTLFIDNASFEKERLLHCVIAMRRVTRYTVYSVRGKE